MRLIYKTVDVLFNIKTFGHFFLKGIGFIHAPSSFEKSPSIIFHLVWYFVIHYSDIHKYLIVALLSILILFGALYDSSSIRAVLSATVLTGSDYISYLPKLTSMQIRFVAFGSNWQMSIRQRLIQLLFVLVGLCVFTLLKLCRYRNRLIIFLIFLSRLQSSSINESDDQSK